MLQCKILLVDDHAAVRAGYRRFIEMEKHLLVAGEASNANDAWALLEQEKIDLAVVDISMPGQSGFELIKRLRLKHPTLKIVVLSMHDTPVIASKAIEQGANGYVTKSSPPEELIQVIHRVLGNQVASSSDIENAQVNVEVLTAREMDIVRSLTAGATIEQTAISLGISAKTVSNNLSQIRQKLNLQTDFELAFWAWNKGLNTRPLST